MKNLPFHKKQVREHRMRNIHERAMLKVDAIGAAVLARSQERWDGMLRELQRCKKETPEQRFNKVYTMLNYDHECELHGKEWIDQHIREMLAGTRQKVLS